MSDTVGAPSAATDGSDVRARILQAAFSAFVDKGYAATSTNEIATRARVSKRELYAQVGNKRQMLISCIGARAARFKVPVDLPIPRDQKTLQEVLIAFGSLLIREITDPTVVAVYRLAISEADHAPEVAQALDSMGRETTRVALRQIMSHATKAGLLKVQPDADLADQFSRLLWGNEMVSLLMGVASRPTPREISLRARQASASFLKLNG